LATLNASNSVIYVIFSFIFHLFTFWIFHLKARTYDVLDVISISSGSTSAEVTPEVVMSSVSPASFPSHALFEHHIHANELNVWLRAPPHTKCRQTKKNWDGTKNYDYSQCSCGCASRITLIYEEDDMIVFKESLVPSNHDEAVDLKKSTSISIINEVHHLEKHHHFDSNSDTKKVC
jgi:hypothetical protein